MFKKNEGILDRIVRVTLGTVLLPTGLFLIGGLHSNVPGLVATGIGGVALVTGLTGVCPSYYLFGISTLEKEKELIAKCRSLMTGSGPTGNLCAGRMCGSDPQRIEKTQNLEG